MFITKWGSYGSEDGQFSYPTSVAVDSSGNVYVADYSNYRIQKFAPAETLVPPAPAREITVDDNSGADFISIQEAVNNSVPGDTIIVKPGTYTENVLVNVTGSNYKIRIK